MSKLPCPSCPWRVEQQPDAIPGFRLELAETLNRTCPDERDMGPDYTDPQFACHHSKPGEELVCRGWLAVCGHRHPQVRLALVYGQVEEDDLRPGDDWPELHPTFDSLIRKLRGSSP